MKKFNLPELPHSDYKLVYADGWTDPVFLGYDGYSKSDLEIYGKDSYNQAIDHVCLLLENISDQSHYTTFEMFNNLIEKIKELNND